MPGMESTGTITLPTGIYNVHSRRRYYDVGAYDTYISDMWQYAATNATVLQ